MKNALVFFAGAAALVIACNHENAPAQGVTTTGAGVVSNDDAVRRLTDARCDRAKACNQFGDKEKYKDEASCKREISHDLKADLRPGECPRGIKQQKLSNCLQEIQNWQCGNVADSISRAATCRTGSLCIDD